MAQGEHGDTSSDARIEILAPKRGRVLDYNNGKQFLFKTVSKSNELIECLKQFKSFLCIVKNF